MKRQGPIFEYWDSQRWNDEMNRIPHPTLPEMLYVCQHCQASYLEWKDLDAHRKTEHGSSKEVTEAKEGEDAKSI